MSRVARAIDAAENAGLMNLVWNAERLLIFGRGNSWNGRGRNGAILITLNAGLNAVHAIDMREFIFTIRLRRDFSIDGQREIALAHGAQKIEIQPSLAPCRHAVFRAWTQPPVSCSRGNAKDGV